MIHILFKKDSSFLANHFKNNPSLSIKDPYERMSPKNRSITQGFPVIGVGYSLRREVAEKQRFGAITVNSLNRLIKEVYGEII